MHAGGFGGNYAVTGSNTGNHTAISGGRKPTADSHAYTLYKPTKHNPRGKFSNGGDSIGGQPDMSFDSGYNGIPNSNLIMIDK